MLFPQGGEVRGERTPCGRWTNAEAQVRPYPKELLPTFSGKNDAVDVHISRSEALFELLLEPHPRLFNVGLEDLLAFTPSTRT